MKSKIILMGVAILSLAYVALAEAGTRVEADRNVESDMGIYNVYACFSTTASSCTVTKTAAMFQTTIAQPAVGAKPSWTYPLGKQGSTAWTAVDLSGNESVLSVPVNFDGLAPVAPMNLVDK